MPAAPHATWRPHIWDFLRQHPDTVAVTSVGAIIAGIFSELNFALFSACLLAFVLDVLAGINRSVVLLGWKSFDTELFMIGWAKKLALVTLIITAGLLDFVGSLVHGAVGQLMSDLTPTLKATMVAVIMSEITSITKNAVAASGRPEIGEIIRRVADRGSEAHPGVYVADGEEGAVVAIEERKEGA